MASVIKSSEVSTHITGKGIRSVAFCFEDIADKANGYLDSVRDQAAAILQEAHNQAERIKKEAAQAGRATAEQAIEQVLASKVSEQMKTLMPAIQTAVQEIEAAKSSWLRHWENAAVHLAAAMAERIIRREISAAPEISMDLVREALSLTAGAESVTLQLNPNDLKNLGDEAKQLRESLGRLAPSEILPDSSITPGGCRVITKYGEVDQRIESQLARLVEEIVG